MCFSLHASKCVQVVKLMVNFMVLTQYKLVKNNDSAVLDLNTTSQFVNNLTNVRMICGERHKKFDVGYAKKITVHKTFESMITLTKQYVSIICKIIIVMIVIFGKCHQ